MKNRAIAVVILVIGTLAIPAMLYVAFEYANSVDCPKYPYLSRCAAYR